MNLRGDQGQGNQTDHRGISCICPLPKLLAMDWEIWDCTSSCIMDSQEIPTRLCQLGGHHLQSMRAS